MPTLIKKAQANKNLISPDMVVVTGLELQFKKNVQRFVVSVAGSEGMPLRFENRTRDLGVIPDHNAFWFVLGETASTENLSGVALDKFKAMTLINKFKAFLLVEHNQKISADDQFLYHSDMVVVRKKK